jgi:hypothetical protein
MTMKRLMMLALIASFADCDQIAAQPAAAIGVSCVTGAAPADSEAPNLHGTWDFVMDVSGTPNFGLLSIGIVDDAYGGSLALWMTAPVVLRKLTVSGIRFHLAVASREGDVLFDGVLSARGDRMCGTVTYHGGRTFPAVAQKRPSTYQVQPPPQPQRAR